MAKKIRQDNDCFFCKLLRLKDNWLLYLVIHPKKSQKQPKLKKIKVTNNKKISLKGNSMSQNEKMEMFKFEGQTAESKKWFALVDNWIKTNFTTREK